MIRDIYQIIWKCDGSVEQYLNYSEFAGRVNTLENQGYEKGVDFRTDKTFVVEKNY